MFRPIARRIVLVSTILLFGGCDLVGAFIGGGSEATRIEVVNRTDDPLYVTAWTQEALSYVRLAHEITAEPGDPALLASGDTLNIDLEDLGDDFGSGDTAVFVIYVPIAEADNRYRLATMLHQSYEQLQRRSFRVPIRPGDLRYELSGDVLSKGRVLLLNPSISQKRSPSTSTGGRYTIDFDTPENRSPGNSRIA